MLVYVRLKDFVCIGKTTNLIQWLRSYEFGHEYDSTEPPHLISYELFAYICSFNNNSHLMYFAIQKWNERGD